MAEITRFAPSPSGYLHIGHAFSARMGFEAAKASGGRFYLRIDDIDQQRCRPEFERAIFEDLAWLGLTWEPDILYESACLDAYHGALGRLEVAGVLYPCFCSRKEIRAEIARLGQAPHGVEGPLYPGTCRHLPHTERQARMEAGDDYALRLDVDKAVALKGPLTWHERGQGLITAQPDLLGDVVLSRKEGQASYHLAVVMDDTAQGITLVTRGEDLREATHMHRLLQALLDLPTPDYAHHRLITDAAGERLAKRADAMSVQSLRTQGHTPASLWAMLDLTPIV